MWKTRPQTEEDYNLDYNRYHNRYYNRYYKEDKEWENATRDEPSTLWFIPQTDPFKVPAITTEEIEKGPGHQYSSYEEKFANFYNSDDYVKDEATIWMMAGPTEETCNANNGFVCEVEF